MHPQEYQKRLEASANGAKRRLRPDEIEAIYGIPTSTQAKMRLSGKSWPYEKIGKSILADPVVIEEWLTQHRRRSTSDSGKEAA